MKVHYLVTAYHEPQHLRRLCDHLGKNVLVQWDSRSPAPDLGSVSVLCSRAPISWGDGSYLRATLDSFEALDETPFDWLVLLSGQDYPIRPIEDLESHLATTSHALYMETQ